MPSLTEQNRISPIFKHIALDVLSREPVGFPGNFVNQTLLDYVSRELQYGHFDKDSLANELLLSALDSQPLLDPKNPPFPCLSEPWVTSSVPDKILARQILFGDWEKEEEFWKNLKQVFDNADLPYKDHTQLLTNPELFESLDEGASVDQNLGFLAAIRYYYKLQSEITGKPDKRRTGESKAIHSARQFINLTEFAGRLGLYTNNNPEAIKMVSVLNTVVILHDLKEDFPNLEVRLFEKEGKDIFAVGDPFDRRYKPFELTIGDTDTKKEKVNWTEIINDMISALTTDNLLEFEKNAKALVEKYGAEFGTQIYIMLKIAKIHDRRDNICTYFEKNENGLYVPSDPKKFMAKMQESLYFIQSENQVNRYFCIRGWHPVSIPAILMLTGKKYDEVFFPLSPGIKQNPASFRFPVTIGDSFYRQF